MIHKLVIFYGLSLLLAKSLIGATLSPLIVPIVSTSTLSPTLTSTESSTIWPATRRRMTPMAFQDFIDPTSRALSTGGAFDLESFTKNTAIRANRNGQFGGSGSGLRNSLLARDMTSFDQDALSNNNNLNSLNNFNSVNDLSTTNQYGDDLLRRLTYVNRAGSSLDPYSALESDFLLQPGGFDDNVMSLSSTSVAQRKLLYLFQLQQQRINQLSAWLEQCRISSGGSYGYSMGYNSVGGGYGLPLAADMSGYGRSGGLHGGVGGYNSNYDISSSYGNGGYGGNYGSGSSSYSGDGYGNGIRSNYANGYGSSYGDGKYGLRPISSVSYGGNYGMGSGYGGKFGLGYYSNSGIGPFGYSIDGPVLGYDSAFSGNYGNLNSGYGLPGPSYSLSSNYGVPGYNLIDFGGGFKHRQRQMARDNKLTKS